jgi:hypothetical protein
MRGGLSSDYLMAENMTYTIMGYERDEIVNLLQEVHFYLCDLEADPTWLDEIQNCLEILGVKRDEE